jgi:Fe-S oxidoreductase
MSHGPADLSEYDHDDERFWDEKKLDTELRRVAEICNGCRLCYNLCPSFPFLFKQIDDKDPHRAEAEGALYTVSTSGKAIEEHEAAEALKHVTVHTDNPVDTLDAQDLKTTVDLCFNCKLCFFKCPYVPPHEFAVDFPKLMVRAKIVNADRDGIGVRERLLGHTDAVGGLMTKIAGIANFAQHNAFNRMLMEYTIGIHRDRDLPNWTNEPFSQWWQNHEPIKEVDPSLPKVALFYTCHGNNNDPETPRAVIDVLEHNGFDVIVPNQRCCGMPFIDAGDLDLAKEQARFNVETLIHAVHEGRKILSPGPSCTLMLKTEYPQLLKSEDARAVADAVVDVGEFLLQALRKKQLKRDFKGKMGKVAYHVPCHNKVQNIGYRGRELLKATGAEIEMVDRCCGMDGTWGMKKEYFQHSLNVAKQAIDDIKAGGDSVTVVTDCPLAGAQLTQGTGKPAYHPAKILRACYRGEAPSVPIPAAAPEEAKPAEQSSSAPTASGVAPGNPGEHS